jgi:lipoprotein NlpD
MPASRALFFALPPAQMFRIGGRLPLCGVWAVALLLGACGSTPVNRAPVEDRGVFSGAAAPVMVSAPTTGDVNAIKALPGAENAGKPGYYTVKPGDTLIRIGLDNGQNWRDIVRWNALANPNQIEVGQVLRVVPPVAGPAPVAAVAAPAASAPAPAANGVATRPVQSGSAAATPVPPAGSAAPAVAPVAANPDDDIIWVWPVGGNVLAGFDDAKNKGVDIGGVAGTPVMAAADGRVVYVGAGLRGYGNLIILKHNNTYLTAYAHNQTLLVKEDQTVHKGQKIAEMGSSDADRVKLHFEVRRQGKPVDPVKYLPPR